MSDKRMKKILKEWIKEEQLNEGDFESPGSDWLGDRPDRFREQYGNKVFGVLSSTTGHILKAIAQGDQDLARRLTERLKQTLEEMDRAYAFARGG